MSKKKDKTTEVTTNKKVFKVKIKTQRCKGCLLCIAQCPAKHLILSEDLNDLGVRYAKINKANPCTGCGICYLFCPDSCIEIYEE